MAKPGPKAPHGKPRVLQGTIRQKAWRAMQIKGKFTLSDLCRAVLTGEEAGADPGNNIGRYIQELLAVGILAEMPRRAPPTTPRSQGKKRWLLVKDLGRAAPVARRNGDVFDPNAGQILPRPVSQEGPSDGE